MKYLSGFLLFSLLALISCRQAPTEDEQSEERIMTPVTITRADTTPVEKAIVLQAVSTFLLKTDVKANINGYIIRSFSHPGAWVRRDQSLFKLETKEAHSIGNTINRLDSSFRFAGTLEIKSPSTGYITMINHQAGDYVQEGEILAGIADQNSFGFMLSLPYEDRQLLAAQKNIIIQLPDSTRLQGTVAQIMPEMDSVSQTQQVFIKTHGNQPVPTGLVAQAILTRQTGRVISLPKPAVLSDESQQHFWVMKLINDSTAIKIPIRKGIENDTRIAIISPQFSFTDSFILQGGYGLPDTASIYIQTPQP